MKVCIASLFNVNREGALTHRVASPSSAASLAAARRIQRAEGVTCLSIQRVSPTPRDRWLGASCRDGKASKLVSP